MARRKRMTKRGNRRNFKRGLHVNGRNMAPPPMRGGFRI